MGVVLKPVAALLLKTELVTVSVPAFAIPPPWPNA